MFLIPSFLAVIATVARKNILIIICGIWVLPGTLYLGVAVIPSAWNLYTVFLIVYFVSRIK